MSDKVYPIPTSLNALVLILQVGAFACIVYLTSIADRWWQVLALTAAMAIVGNSIYSSIHEAEHGMLHPKRTVNDFLGALMALLFPAPYHLIRQGHLGHHRRNRTDEEAFDLYFDGDHAWWRKLILYGIISGFYWWLVVLSNIAVLIAPFAFKRRFFEFDRPSAAFMDALNPRYFWLIQLEAVAAIVLHGMIVYVLDIPLWKYAFVYFGFGFAWSAMQYVHHFETQRDVLNGARNLRFISWIDWIWMHHNWHLAHHQRPNVPWLYLPVLAEVESDNRESLVWHYLRMWRGPRYSATRMPLNGTAPAGSHVELSPTKIANADV